MKSQLLASGADALALGAMDLLGDGGALPV